MLKNRRFNASVTITPIKHRKRQKFVYCIFACKNFLPSLHYVRRWWHSNDDMKFLHAKIQ